MRFWPSAGLWGHPDFLRLWAAQSVSAFGSRITRTALPAIAIETLSASDGAAAFLGVLSIAPAIAVGLVASRFIDRAEKRRLLIGCDLARFAIVVAIPLAWGLGVLALWQVYLAAILAGAATALFQIADNTWLPALVGRERIVEGNSKLATTESLAEIGGPAAAGVLIQFLTAPIAMLVDAATYLWSAAFLARIRATDGAAADAGEASGRASEGLRAVWASPLLRPFFLSEAIGMTGWGFFAALYMLFALRVLDLDVATTGLVIAMGGVGALAGVFVRERLTRVLGAGPAALVFIVLNMGAALLLPLAWAVPAMAVAALAAHQVIGDAFGLAFSVQATSIRQTAMPEAVLGRANAAFQTMNGVALVAGSLAATALAEAAGVLPAVVAGVALQLAAIAPIALSPELLRLRRIEDAATSPATPAISG